jgi:hypothetical protein
MINLYGQEGSIKTASPDGNPGVYIATYNQNMLRTNEWV